MYIIAYVQTLGKISNRKRPGIVSSETTRQRKKEKSTLSTGISSRKPTFG